MLSLSFLRAHRVSVLLFVFFVSVITILSIGKNAIQLDKQADSAIFEQLIDNISNGKGAVSNIFANTQNFIENDYFSKSLEYQFNEMLPGPKEEERNMLKFHAYYVLYPLSAFRFFTDSSMLLAFTQLLIYFTLILMCFLFLKKYLRLTSVAVIGTLLVAVNPNWFIGIMGQFYPDRLFIVFGFLFVWALFAQVNFKWLAVLSIFVCLINERAALVAGLLLLVFEVVHINLKEPKLNLFRISLAIVLLAYFYVQKNFVLTNLYYGGFIPQNMDGVIANINYPGFLSGIVKNLENNSILLFLSLFALRYFVVAFAILSINLVGNVGGAEKTGWLTHYHVYYFPILAFASCVGLLNISRWIQKLNFSKWLLVAPLIVLFVIFSVLQGKGNLNGNRIGPSAAMSSYLRGFKSSVAGQTTMLQLKQEFLQHFSSTDVVSTDELGMMLLHEKTRVAVFPINLEKSTRVLIACTELERNVGQSLVKDKLNALGFVKDDTNLQILNAINRCLYMRP